MRISWAAMLHTIHSGLDLPSESAKTTKSKGINASSSTQKRHLAHDNTGIYAFVLQALRFTLPGSMLGF